MVADEAGGPGNGLLYALVGGLCVVIAGGGFYVYQNSSTLLDTASAPVLTPVQPVDPRQEAGRITTLVDTAHAAIARRDYAAADRALDEAEHIDSHDPAVIQARNDLAEAAHRRHRD